MFREILGNVPRDFGKCSERFEKIFRNFTLKVLENFLPSNDPLFRVVETRAYFSKKH